MPRFITITAPSAWASYLVNGDDSSLGDDEIQQVNAWLAREQVRILSTVEDSERFTWDMRLHAPEAGCSGGEVLDYHAELLEAR
jgi:hypothetical protein